MEKPRERLLFLSTGKEIYIHFVLLACKIMYTKKDTSSRTGKGSIV